MILGYKKNVGENKKLIEPSGQFVADFMAFSATNPQSKIHKYCIFGYFRVNLGTFFFQNEIFAQNRPENTKNGFSKFL